MPSEIAKQIVQQVFGDDKAKAMDSVNDALSATAYDAVQARKVEFAKAMGFELDDTAQAAADEIEAKATDGTDVEPETVEVDGRKPEDPPEDEVVDTAPASIDPPEAKQETEEPKDETDS
tara:strand:- start:725 stop:1084 length:360 start_codon:yes stop_codon:yes gene_type:complete